VLLRRGEESILIAANSVVGVSMEKREGLATTIMQQAGSILLEMEKRNVKHFEVERPYAAAVVKGTQFRVTVEAGKTSVDVVRGQVEVASFKSGQIAQVMAGQHATAFAYGKAGSKAQARLLRSSKAGPARPQLRLFQRRAEASPHRARRLLRAKFSLRASAARLRSSLAQSASRLLLVKSA
jgi:hypothetical protein